MTLLPTLQDELSAAGDRLAYRQIHRQRRRRLLGFAVGGTLLLSGGAVATTILQPVPVDPNGPVAPPPGPGNHGAPHQTSSSALRAHLEPSDPAYLRGTDWGSARSFAIPGTSLRGWTFEQPGRRCLALPDPLAEGYGVICKTPAEVAAGEASVIVLPPRDSGAPNIVGVITSGSERASIEAPPGAATHWARIGDVYAGTAPAGSRLVTATGKKAINPRPAVIVRTAPHPGG
jgi:hypothetical protein